MWGKILQHVKWTMCVFMWHTTPGSTRSNDINPLSSAAAQMSSPVCAPACLCTGVHGWRETWEAGNCCSTVALSVGKPSVCASSGSAWSRCWIINDPVVCQWWQRRVAIGYSQWANTGITRGNDIRDDCIASLLLRNQLHRNGCVTVFSFFKSAEK